MSDEISVFDGDDSWDEIDFLDLSWDELDGLTPLELLETIEKRNKEMGNTPVINYLIMEHLKSIACLQKVAEQHHQSESDKSEKIHSAAQKSYMSVEDMKKEISRLTGELERERLKNENGKLRRWLISALVSIGLNLVAAFLWSRTGI